MYSKFLYNTMLDAAKLQLWKCPFINTHTLSLPETVKHYGYHSSRNYVQINNKR